MVDSINILEVNVYVDEINYLICNNVFTLQPLRAVRVLFSPMVSGWAGGWAGGGKKFVRAVSQKP